MNDYSHDDYMEYVADEERQQEDFIEVQEAMAEHCREGIWCSSCPSRYKCITNP